MLLAKFLLNHPNLFEYYSDFLSFKYLYDSCQDLWEISCFDFFSTRSKEDKIYFENSIYTYHSLKKTEVDDSLTTFIDNCFNVNNNCEDSSSFNSLDDFYDSCGVFDKTVTNIGIEQLITSLADASTYLLTDRETALKIFEMKSLFTNKF